MKNPFNKSTFLLVAVAIIFSSCGGRNTDEIRSKNESSSKTEKISGPLDLNKVYHFYDENDELNCDECDRCWVIKFTDESNGELWSKPCSGSSSLQSCKSTFSYEYNKETKTVTIKSINNSNVSGACKSKFIGDWVWSKGKAIDERFYSKNNPGADFS